MSRLDEKRRQKIKAAFQQTGSIRDTARKVQVSRNAVRRTLKAMAKPAPMAPASSVRPSKLDPYKAKIRHLVCEKHLSSIRVLEEIRELGYQGGYSILKDSIRPIRPKAKRRPTMLIDHPPGHEAQMDWSPHGVILGGTIQTVHTGSLILCFSRWAFIRHFLDETIERVISLHEEAFKELEAVPRTITYDNMTTVGRHTGPGEVWINPMFQRVAEQYGFEIIILPPGAKDRHGMVERPFHYIEHNFLAGREFSDLEDLNRQSDRWQKQVANVRVHGTLRERPLDRLERERPFLKPLPQSKTDIFYREVKRLISRDFTVAIDTNRYSTSPNLIGLQASIRLYQDHLEIWVNGQMDCKHTYCQGRYQRQTLPEHEGMFKKITGQHQLLKQAFVRLGEPAQSYYEGLKKQRGVAAGYHLQRILKLADRHGSDVVAGALAHAQRYGAYSADAIMRVIHGKALKRKGQPEPSQKVPENIRQWLRSCAVEHQESALYDKLVEQIVKIFDKKKQENK
jgi:transposase